MSQIPLGNRAPSSGSLGWAIPHPSQTLRPSLARRRRSPARPAWRRLRELTFAEAASAGMLIVSLVAYAVQQVS